MKRISAAAALALALAAPAHALDQHDVFRQITSDVTCAADHCTTLIGWRGLVAQKCNRFRAPDAPSDQQAVNECSNAQFGLMSALIKANSYGWGWFTDHSEPAWFTREWGCSTPAADGHMHKPDIDGCPFVPGRGW